MNQLEILRRQWMAEAKPQIEKFRIAEDIVARCGCRFCPWRQNWMVSGIGLIQECDKASKLADVSLHYWAVHAEAARADAQNQLEEVIKMMAWKQAHAR